MLALGFIFSGWMKVFLQDKAKVSWPWVHDVPKGFVAFIGIMELLGALGLIFPQALDIAPVLTPLAATALAVVVFCGAVFHVKRHEYREIGVNIVFLALAVFIAIGRL
ncbi:DoxX family protein [Paenibacillus thalictri]|nr:DoxX family protein [Paenibacillus thalictri]